MSRYFVATYIIAVLNWRGATFSTWQFSRQRGIRYTTLKSASTGKWTEWAWSSTICSAMALWMQEQWWHWLPNGKPSHRDTTAKLDLFALQGKQTKGFSVNRILRRYCRHHKIGLYFRRKERKSELLYSVVFEGTMVQNITYVDFKGLSRRSMLCYVSWDLNLKQMK